MRLKRLVARGFKSFADRTEFEFDTRLTGIIGPNGCGKSNVVDAIKWVLGDQRAKSLRGTEMTDVIFKGAEGREAMGMAEVVITFEDPEARTGRTEIDISRRLTLDRESSYLLNGEEVRLKDVKDVLLDTGLGTGGYSVMEQGRIDAVLSANPEARRAIFEEAAGISRFKLQKKEALRKLERTDQNLARITDLLEDRTKRIRSLRIQAGKARRFQELQVALRNLRAALAVLEGRTLLGAAQEQHAQLLEAEAALEGAEAGRDAAAAQLAAAETGIVEAAAALTRVQDELHRCRNELGTHEERRNSQRQRGDDLRAEAGRSGQRSAALAEQRQERHALLGDVRDQLAAKEAALIELHRQLEQQRHQVQAALQRLRGEQSAREQVRQQSLELLHARTRARNAAHDHEVKRDAAAARLARLAERRTALDAEAERLAAERDTWGGQLGDVLVRERLLGEREQVAMADLQQADAAAAELAAREADLRRSLSAVEGRQQALVAMESHLEGLDEAPRHVLQQAPAGLRGRLLDLLDIDLAWSTALEAALGTFVQALVVEGREHAEAIVRELQERRLGRAVLLVEADFGADLEQPHELPLPPGARYLLELVDTARCTPQGRRMLGWLLRGVVLVPSMAHADPSRADLCFVTPDGTLLCGPRVEGGASAEGHAGLVVRRSQILKLGEELAEVQARLGELQTGKDRVVTRVDRLKLELRSVGEALVAMRRRRHEGEAQLARLQARGGDLAREVAEQDLERGELDLQHAADAAAMARELQIVEQLGAQERELQAREQELDQAIAAATAEHESCAHAEQQLRLQQVQAGEAREGLMRSIRMHEENLAAIERSLQEVQAASQKSLEAAAGADREAQRLHELAMVLQDDLVGHEARREQAAAALDLVRAEQRERQQVLRDCDAQRMGLQGRVNELKLALADSEHRFARIEERLREESDVELRRCLGEVEGIGLVDARLFEGPVGADVECLQGPPLPPAAVQAWLELEHLWERAEFDPLEARKEVQVLAAQKDRLGAVNLDAVRELDQEEGQFGDHEREVGDLKEARKSLMETLRKLEAESKLLFEQTFVEARKNFQEIFRKLFQGGKADMHLSIVDDTLDAGIEIVAQPPGKQLQSINLLSGGERSLTAVAILFALFKVRPSPFCILDEVDAALDETNVERFLRVLRDFTHDTQFCIVTHHKRTMADCQVLYGITMQRRGVSSRIAVSLQEVDSFQEGATAAPVVKDKAQKQRIAGEEPVGF